MRAGKRREVVCAKRRGRRVGKCGRLMMIVAEAAWRDRIELNPEILTGKPVVRGTRLAVEYVLDMLDSGVAEAQILENHPRLTHEDVLACVAYATDVLKSERVYPVPE